MGFSLNRVSLAGHLTRDPELRTVGDKQVANFGIAINHKYKTADGQQKEDVTFIDIETWARTAELVGQYLTKGSHVYIDGRLKLEQWDDKKDGTKRSKLKVVADSVQFLSAKPDGERPKDKAQVAHAAATGDDSGIPF
jgi:single-strand DNA-binding protein